MRVSRQVKKRRPSPEMEVALRYEFIVIGSVSRAVEAELSELVSTPYPTGGTALFGPVQDESDVLTMFSRISNLGLTVFEMRWLPD